MKNASGGGDRGAWSVASVCVCISDYRISYITAFMAKKIKRDVTKVRMGL